MPLDRFRQAKTNLERGNDLVIGPAEDGGTYILGVTSGREDGFEAIPWSTGREQAELDRRARERGWSVALLESWYDVDRPADLCRFSVDLRAALSAGELERGTFEEEVRFVEELARRRH